MNIIKSILTKNPCYTGGRKLDNGVMGLMLHSVGCSQPKASVFVNSWNSPSFGSACVHAFIDGLTGDIYQTLPWDWRGWHCASGPNGSGNNTHIGVEMCEPACITYTGGSSFTCSDKATAKAVAERTYKAAVELFAYLCKEYNLNPMTDIISHKEGHAKGIASNHGDPEHLWSGLGTGYTMDTFRKAVKAAMGDGSTAKEEKKGTQASAFAGLNEKEAAAKCLELCRKNAQETGIFASVSAAQMILESGYVTTELAKNANNCFGMKKSLSGNTWAGSSWDGKSIYTKKTGEETADGKPYTITADFRKYPCIEDSIADHSAYLLGAMNGSKKRYDGIQKCKNYTEQITLIKNGGYATDTRYVSKICDIIKRFGLDKYDKEAGTGKPSGSGTKQPTAGFVPYVVRVKITNLNIRTGPGTGYTRTQYCPVGSYTIVEEKTGKGAKLWGRLKSGAGWIALDYTERV